MFQRLENTEHLVASKGGVHIVKGKNSSYINRKKRYLGGIQNAYELPKNMHFFYHFRGYKFENFLKFAHFRGYKLEIFLKNFHFRGYNFEKFL